MRKNALNQRQSSRSKRRSARNLDGAQRRSSAGTAGGRPAGKVSIVGEYDAFELVAERWIVPGSVVAHTSDRSARGIVVSSAARVTVAWGRAPFFETVKITSTTITAASRKLRTGWQIDAQGRAVIRF